MQIQTYTNVLGYPIKLYKKKKGKKSAMERKNSVLSIVIYRFNFVPINDLFDSRSRESKFNMLKQT